MQSLDAARAGLKVGRRRVAEKGDPACNMQVVLRAPRYLNFYLLGILVAHLAEHTGSVNRIAVAPDSRFFATAADDGEVKIWDCHVWEALVMSTLLTQFMFTLYFGGDAGLLSTSLYPNGRLTLQRLLNLHACRSSQTYSRQGIYMAARCLKIWLPPPPPKKSTANLCKRTW